MEGVLSKGVLSGNGLCLEGVMYGGGFVRGGFVRAPFGSIGLLVNMLLLDHCISASKFDTDPHSFLLHLCIIYRGY